MDEKPKKKRRGKADANDERQTGRATRTKRLREGGGMKRCATIREGRRKERGEGLMNIKQYAPGGRSRR